MLDRKQIWAVFLLESKMYSKAAQITHNINNAFGPGTAKQHTLQRWLKKLCWGDERVEVEEHSGWLLEGDSDQLRAII